VIIVSISRAVTRSKSGARLPLGTTSLLAGGTTVVWLVGGWLVPAENTASAAALQVAESAPATSVAVPGSGVRLVAEMTPLPATGPGGARLAGADGSGDGPGGFGGVDGGSSWRDSGCADGSCKSPSRGHGSSGGFAGTGAKSHSDPGLTERVDKLEDRFGKFKDRVNTVLFGSGGGKDSARADRHDEDKAERASDWHHDGRDMSKSTLSWLADEPGKSKHSSGDGKSSHGHGSHDAASSGSSGGGSNAESLISQILKIVGDALRKVLG
jgi:hypothetical protein